MQGWIKLHRKMLDNPVVCKDSDHLAVWVYLLLNATHESYPALFRGEKIILEPGQLITGRKSISQKLGIDESKTQRIIKSLKNEQQIEQQTSNQNRLITILRWDDYQNCEQPNEQRVNNECTTDEQRVNTNKNVKKVKNVKNDKKYIDDLPSELRKPVEEFILNRKAIKKPMTDRAVELMLKELNKLSGGDNQKSIKILEQSIRNGWVGIFPLKEQSIKEDPYIKIMREEIQNEQNRVNGSNENNQPKLPQLL